MRSAPRLTVGVLIATSVTCAALTAHALGQGTKAPTVYWPAPRGEDYSNRDVPAVKPYKLLIDGDPERPMQFPVIVIEGERGNDHHLPWANWGSPTTTAEGTATWDEQTRSRSSVRVIVSMTGIHDCFGWEVYSRYTVALAPGQPAPSDWDFSRAASGQTIPCEIGAACGSKASCSFPRSDPERAFRTATKSRMRFAFGGTSRAYWVKYTGWNAPTASGTGIISVSRPLGATSCKGASDGSCRRVYPVRFVFSDRQWCRSSFQYTALKVTVYGQGQDDPPISVGQDPTSPSRYRSAYESLRGAIGHAEPRRSAIAVLKTASRCEATQG